MSRQKFDAQLEQLNIEMIMLGSLCEDAIQYSLKALLEDDHDSADIAIEKDKSIDKKEREIEGLCMRLFIQQQPVAKDLRFISSALKMISDMERIGDQAADIAEIAKLVHYSDKRCDTHLKEMADLAIKMVTQSVDSFVKGDLKLAHQVIEYDDIMDDLFDKIKDELIMMISQNKENGEFCIDLLMVSKYLERIGDHATNIAEWVEYSLIGAHDDELTEDELNRIMI